ncbi:3-deoxy-D-manno-octulosonic acid transferase [Nitrospirota bacterium]
MIRHLYSAAYAIMLPFLFPGQYRKRAHGTRKMWLAEKVGIYKKRKGDAPLLWVHAVSVGEVVSAVTFIDAFRERYPEHEIVVSTITDTGRKVAIDKLKDRAEVVYLPFDLPVFIRRAIRALRPSVFVVIETEIWPNLFYCMKSAGIPMALLNGRISDKSFRLYRKLRRALVPVLSCVDAFSMQDETYAGRIIEMGAEPSSVHNTGSFKFDLRLKRSVIEWVHGLKRPIVVAGSTHRGEEELIAKVFLKVLSKREASLILVPRHPERAGEVEGVLRKNGLSDVLRSSLTAGQTPQVDVVLVDTVGELSSIYAEADIAVMGGSFIPHGGQNPLEPAYWGKPVICGPHMENFPFMEEFYDEEAALRADEWTLEEVLEGLLASEDIRANMGKRALEIFNRNRGAVERAMSLVEGLIGEAR